jgi:DHA1 family bicyclomycin/chloramphenicol resistance-like MFS transporter
MVNMTLSVYFITYAAGLLFWGPLSEKFGRKPIMLVGLAVYIAASILCALAGGIEFLIFARMLQAFGGSAVTVVATAIVKDLFSGREREKVMATIMSLVVIAPMVAPVLGAFLLEFASWQMLFVVLAIFGALSVIFALFYQETLEQKYTGSVFQSWGRMGVVLQNPRFTTLLGIFSVAPMAMMAFLAAGSYIYIEQFGMSEQQFSFVFAFNALCATVGPTLYMRLSKHIPVQTIVSGCFAIMAAGGLMVFALGHLTPWLLAPVVALVTLTVIAMRIPGTNLMLDQQDQDTGSVAALIQFFGMLMGSAGMFLVSLQPDNLIQSLGMIQLVVGISGSVLWLLVRNRPFVTERLATVD